MFSPVSIRRIAPITVLALLAALGLTPEAPASAAPSAAEVRAAVSRAERSKDLWATINVCNKTATSPRGYKQLGVRVQMPALGFNARLFMAVRIQYWDSGSQKFLDTTEHFGPASFGVSTHRAVQGGALFAFKPLPTPQTFLMRGRATLEWRIGKRVLGRVHRTTGKGFKFVDGGSPRGLSVATCTIKL